MPTCLGGISHGSLHSLHISLLINGLVIIFHLIILDCNNRVLMVEVIIHYDLVELVNA